MLRAKFDNIDPEMPSEMALQWSSCEVYRAGCKAREQINANRQYLGVYHMLVSTSLMPLCSRSRRASKSRANKRPDGNTYFQRRAGGGQSDAAGQRV